MFSVSIFGLLEDKPAFKFRTLGVLGHCRNPAQKLQNRRKTTLSCIQSSMSLLISEQSFNPTWMLHIFNNRAGAGGRAGGGTRPPSSWGPPKSSQSASRPSCADSIFPVTARFPSSGFPRNMNDCRAFGSPAKSRPPSAGADSGSDDEEIILIDPDLIIFTSYLKYRDNKRVSILIK
ncbi:unnamed protein product [Nesidiocoris tenuis]|uniref:Uncharacterized protein n=1 Tax=Nesidiocoris tenuis TaxID=355587 RepID=A0A6H5HHM0_9HEMI|nr:unnamed protein product [Nesidiocoris tenuis]